MEIIVVDGMSKDKTLFIIQEKLKRCNIKSRIYSDNGKGLGAARNIVCRNAKGEYILWVDADIVLPKEHVKEQVEFLEKNLEIGVAKAKYGVSNSGNVVANIENMRTVELSILRQDVHLFTRGKYSSNLVGTGASIFRRVALKQVGYFDERIKGAGEDIDVATRIMQTGWKLAKSPAIFYERFRPTWKELWKEYFWWGYGMHYVSHKHSGLLPIWANLPHIAFVKGILQTPTAFNLSRKKEILLLPFHSFYKMSAWCIGYQRSHFEQYGHGLYISKQFNVYKKMSSMKPIGYAQLPKVTVGICVKNSEKTIEETLISIRKQDYPKDKMDIIVVDDHSKDTTSYLAKKFAQSYPGNMRIFSTNHGGLGEGRQTVVDNTSSKYIVWIDGDIKIPKNHIYSQVSFLEKHPHTAIAKGREISIEKGLIEQLESLRPFLYDYWARTLILGTGGSTYRVDAIKEAGGFDKLIKGAGEDVDIVHRIHKSGWSTAATPIVFYHRLKGTWKNLWQRYYWYGYGIHYVRNKHNGEIPVFTSLPFVAFFVGILHAAHIFRQTKNERCFVLPIEYSFKRSAWCLGYVMSHFDHYGHNKKGL
jgi:glycosyltransferase involved in cell wall biosynthesis